MSQGEKIEIPSVELLTRHRDVVNKLWEVSRATRVEPGWHYLLDLTWIVENLGPVNRKQILDAGAGMPQGDAWGGTVAAPVFSRVGEQVLNYLGVGSHEPVTLAMAR